MYKIYIQVNRIEQIMYVYNNKNNMNKLVTRRKK